MQVVVLLAGVVDPKARIEQRLALRPDGGVDAAGLAWKLSPFDEAALEIALQLRDADPAAPAPAVRVTALVAAAEEALPRAVLALRPDRTARIPLPPGALWDAQRAAILLDAAIRAAGAAPDLVLLGREFGDADDGTLPALLAELRGSSSGGCRFLARAHAVRREGGSTALLLRRARGGAEEELRLAPPVLASVTNDRGNRLRHPLLKNVMLARRAPPVEALDLPAPHPPPRVVPLAAAPIPPRPRGAGACRMLDGPREARIAALAEALRRWRDAPP